MDEVSFKQLKSFIDQEGELFETLRSDDSIYSGKFGQNLISIVNPGIIKGLHYHTNQMEYTTCVKGNILYVAITEIDKGFRFNQVKVQKFISGERNRIMIKTPPKIWHGFTPLDNKEAVVLYTMDKPYDSQNPDTLDRKTDYYGDIWNLNDM